MTRHALSLVIAVALVLPAFGQSRFQANPPQPKSTFIVGTNWDKERYHKGDGDMWPLTWAADGNMYGSAGDNQDSPMNFWKIVGDPPKHGVYLIDNLPVDPAVYCRGPNVDRARGIKPAGLLSVGGVLYYAVETMNYGDNPA